MLHKCDVPACINPDHLFLGTHDENMTDMVAKGRSEKIGTKNPAARLTEDKVKDMRRMRRAGVLIREIAVKFGISESHAGDVVSGRLWAHVDTPTA